MLIAKESTREIDDIILLTNWLHFVLIYSTVSPLFIMDCLKQPVLRNGTDNLLLALCNNKESPCSFVAQLRLHSIDHIPSIPE